MGTIGRTNTGGAGLNLTILASVEQPPSPVENLVWINTDTAIPNWYWQTDEPAAGEKKEGVLWITINALATNKLDLLRNNNLVVGFGTPRQYKNGNWETVGGKIYYNGSWHNLQTFVYDGTIGNAENNFNHDVGGYPWNTSKNINTVSVTGSSDSFTCYYFGGTGGSGLCYSNKKIDFTEVKSVKIVYTGSGEGRAPTLRATVFASASGGSDSGCAASANLGTPLSKTTVTINTENVTGTYYLGFFAGSDSSGYQWSRTFKIFSIELIS